MSDDKARQNGSLTSYNEPGVLTLPTAPSRSAKVLDILSTKSGYLMKRNESNVWSRRFCCVVPHTFLYYFEDNVSTAPVGIIDLECYTAITGTPGHIMELRGEDRANKDLRKFYFQAQDAEESEAWASYLLKDR